MLTEFETRFANVLGSRLPTPFGGRVRRRGAAAPTGAGPVIRLGVEGIEPLEPDFSSVRPEVVGGSTDHRRIVRLGVSIGFDVVPQSADDRLQEVLGIDALVYELLAPDVRSAEALVQPGDQGFLIESIEVVATESAMDSDLVARAEGWFWPPGAVGETGRPIERALVREFRLPMQLTVAAPLEAGGAAVSVDLALGATGTMQVTGGATTSAPFGSLALRLIDDGGGPGGGALSGGQPGPDGTTLVSVEDGIATFSYGPPGAGVTDHLVVGAYARDTDGNERVGVELARFDLVVSP